MSSYRFFIIWFAGLLMIGLLLVFTNCYSQNHEKPLISDGYRSLPADCIPEIAEKLIVSYSYGVSDPLFTSCPILSC